MVEAIRGILTVEVYTSMVPTRACGRGGRGGIGWRTTSGCVVLLHIVWLRIIL